MPSLPRIASEVSATLSLTAPPRGQASAAGQGDNQDSSDSTPFASLLDATAPAPAAPSAPTAAAQTAPPVPQSTPAPATPTGTAPRQADNGATVNTTRAAPASANAVGRDAATAPASAKQQDAGTNGTSDGAANGSSATALTVILAATATAGAAANPNAIPSGAGSTAAAPASNGTPGGSKPCTTNSDAAAGPVVASTSDDALAAALPAAAADGQTTNADSADSAAATAQPSTPKKVDGDNADDASADADAGTVATAGQVPAAAMPQPVAAAIVVGNLAPAAPTTAGGAPSSDVAIGDRASPRGQTARVAGDGANGLATPLLSGAPPAISVSPTANSSAAAAAQAGATATQPGNSDKQVPAGAATSQQQQADTIAAQPQQTDGSGQPNFVATAHLGATGMNGSADTATTPTTQVATNTSKPANADLANLGLAPANPAVMQTVAAAPGTPPAAAVPVAGLPIAIIARAQDGSNQFEIRLHPPELGRIEVRLDVDSKGQVTSHVTVDRPETLSLLQNQQPQLERALEQAGLKTADNGLQFTLRDQSFTGQNPSGGTPQQSAPQLVIPDPDLPPIETTQIYSRVSLGGGLDIRV